MTPPPGGALAWLQLARAPAVFTALSNIVAAHLVATGGRVDWVALVALSLAGCSLYTGGMILNDCFDREVDARERPDRPLPSGAVGLNAAWFAGALGLVAGVAAAALNGVMSLTIAAALALAILAYDGWAKDSVFGPVNMGLCRYLNWLLGLSVLALTARHLLVPVPVLLYVSSLTLISRVEVDAESRGPVILALVGILAAGLSFGFLIGQGPLDLLAALAFFGAVLVRVGMLLRDFTPATAQQTVGLLVFGIIPLDALLVLSTGQWLGACVVLLLMLPGRLLSRWMYVT